MRPEEDRATTLVDLERKMARWRHEAEELVGRPVRSSVVAGDAASEITRLARERPFDLVVVGTHGRRGLKRLFLGSVAERVVREADCAVLVARREEEED
jgi:nucleotide-binding universal stress UspA family protein